MKRVFGVAAMAWAAPALAADLTRTTNDFCPMIQQRLEGTTMTAENVVHPDFVSFQESKASVQPLRTEQYVEYADAAAKTDPLRVSC